MRLHNAAKAIAAGEARLARFSSAIVAQALVILVLDDSKPDDSLLPARRCACSTASICGYDCDTQFPSSRAMRCCCRDAEHFQGDCRGYDKYKRNRRVILASMGKVRLWRLHRCAPVHVMLSSKASISRCVVTI